MEDIGFLILLEYLSKLTEEELKEAEEFIRFIKENRNASI